MQVINIFFLIILSLSTADAQENASIDSLGRAIVEALKQKSYNTQYKNLVVTPQLYFDESLPQMKNDPKHHIPEFIIQNGNNFYRRNMIDSLNRKLFHGIKEQAAQFGIEWAKVTYIKFRRLSGESIKNEDLAFGDFLYFGYNKDIFSVVVTAGKFSVGYRVFSVYALSRVTQ